METLTNNAFIEQIEDANPIDERALHDAFRTFLRCLAREGSEERDPARLFRRLKYASARLRIQAEHPAVPAKKKR